MNKNFLKKFKINYLCLKIFMRERELSDSRRKRGFTLIELLVVISIIGFLATPFSFIMTNMKDIQAFQRMAVVMVGIKDPVRATPSLAL